MRKDPYYWGPYRFVVRASYDALAKVSRGLSIFAICFVGHIIWSMDANGTLCSI